MTKETQCMQALINIGHALSIENSEQFHSVEYAEERIITAIKELRREYLVALDRAEYAEARYEECGWSY